MLPALTAIVHGGPASGTSSEACTTLLAASGVASNVEGANWANHTSVAGGAIGSMHCLAAISCLSEALCNRLGTRELGLQPGGATLCGAVGSKSITTRAVASSGARQAC